MLLLTSFVTVNHQAFRKQRILILASGGGSNAACIMSHFSAHARAEVVGVVSDRKDAGVHQRAAKYGVPSRFVGKERREKPGGLLEVIHGFSPDLLVLAGYLRLIPQDVLASFPERVVNIHPALLPKYGGPGMYGHHVHSAVAKTQDAFSGITIHLADEKYDEGRILFQASIALTPHDDAEAIAAKVLSLEHSHYPKVLDAYLQQLNKQLSPLLP